MTGELAGFACLMLLFVTGCCVAELVNRARRRRPAKRRPRHGGA